jgi:hypothetical protein
MPEPELAKPRPKQAGRKQQGACNSDPKPHVVILPHARGNGAPRPCLGGAGRNAGAGRMTLRLDTSAKALCSIRTGRVSPQSFTSTLPFTDGIGPWSATWHIRDIVIGLGQVMSKRRGRLLFVNKKKQKNFLNWVVLVSLPRAQANRSFFAPLFSKKRLLSCSHLNLSGSDYDSLLKDDSRLHRSMMIFSLYFREPLRRTNVVRPILILSSEFDRSVTISTANPDTAAPAPSFQPSAWLLPPQSI